VSKIFLYHWEAKGFLNKLCSKFKKFLCHQMAWFLVNSWNRKTRGNYHFL